MNKNNIKNKMYFVVIALINIYTITSLFLEVSSLYSAYSILSRAISLGLIILVSLISGILLFKNKNKMILKNLKPLGLFIIFWFVLCVVATISLIKLDFPLPEQLAGFMSNYYLSFLIIPNILLNIYSILMSVDKK